MAETVRQRGRADLWLVTVLVQRRTGNTTPPLDPDRFTSGGPVT
jgi:hypothetical protein